MLYKKFAHSEGSLFMAWFDRNPGGKKGPEENRPAASPEPRPAEPVAPVQVAPPRPAEPEPGLVAYLYKGSRVSGQLTFQGPVKIDGSVDGEIQCHGILTIGDGAEVRARISGQVVVVRGRVEGNVVAKERVELIAPARLIGNIKTPRLVITEGVVFDGDCSMGVAREKGGAASAQSVNAEKASAAPKPKLQAESDK